MRAPLRIVVRGGGQEPRERLAKALSSRGYGISATPIPPDAPPPDVVLFVGEEASTWSVEARRAAPAHLIVVDERPELERAIAALRAGAADYVQGGAVDAVQAAMERLSMRSHVLDQLERLSQDDPARDVSGPALLGESPALLEVRERIARLENSTATVLVTGESGTGKEVVARLLHGTSLRRDGPFVAVNCAAIPSQLAESEYFGHARGAFTDAVQAKAGLLARAHGGTLFLDEVAAMPRETQAKLLRALQERTVRPLGQGKEVPFDARVIAATDSDLGHAVERGHFRRDLYFRLNVVPIHVPPLRERGLDVLLLAHHFVRRFAGAARKPISGLTPGAAHRLLGLHWPGNVRELSNWMEAAVAVARHDRVTDADLAAARAGQALDAGDGAAPREEWDVLGSWTDFECRHIALALRQVQGNKTRAARILGIDRKTLYRKLKKCGCS